jgi:hypothetical protein
LPQGVRCGCAPSTNFLDETEKYVFSLFVSSAPPTPVRSLQETLRLIIIGGLCEAVARRISADRTAGPLILLIDARLRRLVARFTSLAARFQAGKLRPPRHRKPQPRPPRERQRLLPESFGWLIRFVPYQAACFGSQLQHQLSQPEMVALIEAAPQAGRILRPLCRMLAVPLPPSLRLPPRPPKPRKPKPPRQPAAEPSCDTAPASGRKPRHPPSRGEDGTVYEWRRWRGIWMPEPVRPPKPA